ncbi:hypothetical protein ASPZODRAFT_136203 [Penicilliopsis zonata CBS 506.65]|uniref:AB hydrolase-1 domain-containing protein n=1 Tax=Penicilliopsis zonata CBS 506.65 TaxID=1073090 RepID=A0A1L9S876_9EURO|nr:hypothetical protein ASPZODRAFT_136203 [Penicilliopsis zonata CBS 506.65]OJJ43357.1 hypothetical protein ASPZODRAFT_136203 [Penicilliopsis zonata CBS 506.65]
MSDPLETLEGHLSNTPSVSRRQYPIAGILTTVYGLNELSSPTSEIACLWLLHPRLGSQEAMSQLATLAITDWNKKILQGQAGPKAKGLIAVSFDQRNHGTRIVDPVANEAWRSGNPRHAQDMFSIFQGTARDVSLLIDYLPAFVFPESEKRITEHLVLGVSLGAYAAWSCILHEPRVSAGITIIGCPDYVNIMADRARLSKLASWKGSEPEGSQFLGSKDFPFTLLETVRRLDPASLFLSYTGPESEVIISRPNPLPEPTPEQQEILRPVLSRCLARKKILNIAGGADKLVPYRCGEAFLAWLKKAVGPDGWFKDGAVTLEDVIDPTARHEVTPKMADEAIQFVSRVLLTSNTTQKTGFVRHCKI